MAYDENFLTSYLEFFLANYKNKEFGSEYIRKIPDNFYRFRSCKMNDFNSLEQNYIWLSFPSEFNDVKDSTIKYSLESQREVIYDLYLEWLPYIMKNEIANKRFGLAFSDLENNKKIIDVYKLSIIDDGHTVNNDKLRLYFLSKGLKVNQANLVIDQMNKVISSEAAMEKSDEIIEIFKQKMQQLKDSYYVTCFTETFENDNLWETYAERYTGFCIEYNFNLERKEKLLELLYNFAPMIYNERKAIDLVDIFRVAKKHYCKEEYDKNIIHNIDLEMNLHTRTKSVTYDHEMEWRFYQKIDSEIDRKFHFPYINRIILGKDIKPRNKARLINIAKRNKFDVYQQEFNSFTSSFTYFKIDTKD